MLTEQKLSKNPERHSVRALVVGAGAIGAFYGHALSLSGVEVSVVCRSEYDHVQSNGYSILSEQRGDIVFRPHQTLKSVSDYQGLPPDYLILTVKVTQGVDRVGLIKPAVGPNTTIVLIENGIEIEQEIAAAFPNNPLISCLAFVQVSRLSPGVIRHFAFGDLTIGNFPRGISKECEIFSECLAGGKINAPVTDDVVNARWQKCVWNASFNPVSVIGGPANTHQILNFPDGEKLISDLMHEVIAIAKATGNDIPVALVNHYIEATKKAPAYKTSMALDRERDQAMEVEAILGNTIRAARREGVNTPKLDGVYALMQMLQATSA